MFPLTSAPPVENGDAEMAAGDTWEQKGSEPSQAEAEPGGDGGQAEEDSPQEEGMEEEEEVVPTPKVVPTQPNAPKKEHVNVVFIGHVG